MHKTFWVYIMMSANETLYIGVTSNLHARNHMHKSGLLDGFSARYRTHKLVYFEEFADAYTAISREKQLKRWSRAKKVALIRATNPWFFDLKTDG